jgi:hypothetical protein
MVKETVAAFGQLDAAYNNAGIQNVLVETADYPRDDYDRVETESSPAFTAVKSPIQIAQDVEGESVDLKGFDKVSRLRIRPHGSKCEANQSRATVIT